MAQTEEITVVFKTEGGDTVSETFNKAAAGADKYHQSVTKAGGALSDLRIKSEARVASNIGAIVQSMAQGGTAADVFATAVIKLGESFRGSLLFAGAATVGLGLYEAIIKYGEAVQQVQTNIDNLRASPKQSADFLGTDQIKKNLTDIQTQIVQLRAQQAERTQPTTILGVPFHFLGTETEAGLNRVDQLRINQLREGAVGNIEQLTQKQRELNRAQREGISGSVLESQLEQEQITHRERLGELGRVATAAGTDVNSVRAVFQLFQSEKERSQNVTDDYRKEADLRNEQFDLEQKIIDIQKQGLSTGSQTVQTIEAQISATQALLGTTSKLNDVQKQAAQTRLGQLQVAQADTQQGIFERGPFQYEREEFTRRINRAYYQEARDRFQQQELQRRLGNARDVRRPGLREYEEVAFGPFVPPAATYGNLPRLPYGTNVNTGELAPKFDKLIDTLNNAVNKMLEIPTIIGIQ